MMNTDTDNNVFLSWKDTQMSSELSLAMLGDNFKQREPVFSEQNGIKKFQNEMQVFDACLEV